MNKFLEDTGVKYPIICGPMYPCSNPELVASISEAGAIGIVQPVSLTYVYGYDFIDGLKYIKSLTSKPIGMNVLIEKSSQKYHEKMIKWINIALDEGVRFFITSLGKPDWVVEMVHARGGKVYHDVTELKWAKIAIESNVDGLICVNNRAGGHAGQNSAKKLYEELKDLGLPLVCAGGIGDENEFKEVLDLGYEAVQMGTRFISTTECKVPQKYKEEIVRAKEEDIVLTKNMTGIPVSVINNEYIQDLGTTPGKLASWMLNNKNFKHLMRLIYTIKSFINLKSAVVNGKKEFFQAGKSVQNINKIESVEEIINRFSLKL